MYSNLPVEDLSKHVFFTDMNSSDTPDITAKQISQYVYFNNLMSTTSGTGSGGIKLPDKPPVYDKTTLNQAPFSIGSNGESISTLSGSMSLQDIDMTLSGRGGMSFGLKRLYNTDASQFYGMDASPTYYDFPIDNYYVQYAAVKKQIIQNYTVKYTESYWIQEDTNGDGSVDYSTAIIGSENKVKGSYGTKQEADQSVSQGLTYSYSDSLSVSTSRTSSTNSFPSLLKL